MPIPYMTIRAYCQDHGIEGDDYHLFRTMFDMLDAEWLNQAKDKADKEEKARESNGR